MRRGATARPNRRYLGSNLWIAALVILLVSADLADPLRFKQVWITHVTERKRMVAVERGEPSMGTFQNLLLTFQSNIMYKQCEVVITYVLQTVCTMMTTRTLVYYKGTSKNKAYESFTKACNEQPDQYPGLEMTNAVFILILTWVVIMTFMPLILAAFAHSLGPAPPIGKEQLKVGSARRRAHPWSLRCPLSIHSPGSVVRPDIRRKRKSTRWRAPRPPSTQSFRVGRNSD